MNVNPLVMAALAPLKLPIFPNVWRARRKDETPPDSYFVFDYEDERPLLMVGDVQAADVTYFRVHLFTRSADVQAMKKETRRALRLAGFSVCATAEFYEVDTKYTHIVVSLCIDGDGD